MPRIRSIHPSLFTDEAYMAMSMTAKAAWPGIWTDCDDHGAFEWKPIVLKAKLFPADPVDMVTVLAEFVQRGCVVKCEINGKVYGLVKNFCRFQRPKKPKYNVVLPSEYHSFVGLPSCDESSTGTEPVPNLFGTGTEQVAQMEDGKGEKEEEDRTQPLAAREAALSSHIPAWERIRLALGVEADDPNWFSRHGRVAQWLANGWDLELDILPTVTRIVASRKSRGKTPARSLEFFEDAIADALAARTAPVPVVQFDRGKDHATASGGGLKGSLAKLRERREELERPAIPESGGNPARLLSDGRRDRS
jgi:nitrogen fixation protein